MKVVDTRSGELVAVGQTIVYPDDESVTLLEVKPGLLSARAKVRTVSLDFSVADDSRIRPDGTIDASGLPTKTWEGWVDLTVRWLHPAFPLQHVGFLPS